MHPALKFRRQYFIDQAVALEPGFAGKGLRNDVNPVMSLTALAPAAMTFVTVRFILHGQAFWREGFGQLLDHDIFCLHALLVSRNCRPCMPPLNIKSCKGGPNRPNNETP